MGNVRPGIGTRLVLLCLLIAGPLLFMPSVAAAWGKSAHLRIAKRALEELPPHYRSQIEPHKDDLFRGAIELDAEAVDTDSGSQLGEEIQSLMLIPYDGAGPSRYFVFRLGRLSRAVADRALPFSRSTDSPFSQLQNEFEEDIEDDLGSFPVCDVSPICITYPSSYMERVAQEAQRSEHLVRETYLDGGRYPTCRDEVVLPSFRRAVEAVANVWMTVLSSKPASMAMSTPRWRSYLIEQIRYSSENEYLDDLYSALQFLNKRIPFTPKVVGKAFFRLPCNSESIRIYSLAESIDPQSSVLAERRRACDRYVLQNPEPEPSVPERKFPSHMYGKEGKPPSIYVYQHSSGLKIFTSKVKEVGDDYVLLNYEPIKKIVRKKVIRTIKVKQESGGTRKEEVVEFDLEQIINLYAKDYDVPPALVKAIIKVESDFNPHAVSSAGARGLMQLMPMTALEMQVKDSFDPIQNVGGGVQYFARMRELFDGDVRLALAAYNAGPGNVLRYGGMPPFKETQKYVPKVLGYYERYESNPPPVRRLRVALNKKPSPDYLPDVETTKEVVEEVEEVVLSMPKPKPPPPGQYVVVYFTNGETMRGKTYEKTPKGVRLELEKERGWVLIREDLITKIT
jgi:hypothetical protein